MKLSLSPFLTLITLDFIVFTKYRLKKKNPQIMLTPVMLRITNVFTR